MKTPMHRRHEDSTIDAHMRRSLRYSMFEGASFFSMVGAAEGYFQAFALFLKAKVFQVGLVSTLPLSIASVLQLFSRPVQKLSGSRRRFNVGAGAVRTLVFIPLALSPFMGQGRVWILLALVCAYYSLNYLPNPAWTSWMRDLVDDSQRGRFFGRRNAAGNIAGLVASMAAGLALQAYSGSPLYGFLLVFGVAVLGSTGSTVSLSRQYDPEGQSPAQESQGMLEFVRGLTRTNYGRFVICNFAVYFGAYIASPFVVPFMLAGMGFSYLQFMVATSVVSLVKFASLPLWGTLGDHYGTKKTLALSGFMICLSPFTWLLAGSFLSVCLIQVFGAFAWAGFEIAALSFAYDAMPAERVTTQTSFLLFFRGLAIVGGGLAGGALLPHVHGRGSSYLGLFVVSAIFRLVCVLPLLFLIREERKVPRISYPGLALKLLTLPSRALIRRWFSGPQS
jgi:MFS family permease